MSGTGAKTMFIYKTMFI